MIEHDPAAAMTGRANPDSRARTHLANERTFLAWLRTGLSMIALGLVAAEFLSRHSLPIALLTDVMASVLIAGGLVLTLVGLREYRRGQAEIEAGGLRPAGGAILVGTALVALVGVLAVGFIVLTD